MNNQDEASGDSAENSEINRNDPTSRILKILSLKELSEKVDKLEKKGRKWLTPASIPGLVTALVAIIGVFFSFGKYQYDKKRLHLEEIAQSIFKVNSMTKQDEFELRLRTARKNYVDELKGDFDDQRHAIKSIAEIEGVDVAVKLERAFRTGGTITGLKEYKVSATSKCTGSGNPKEVSENRSCIDRTEILKALRDAPVALFIDSLKNSNIYCEDTRKSGGTNLDDIFNIVRDLPMFIDREIGDRLKDDPNNIEAAMKIEATAGNIDMILDSRADLIVMHAGAFEGTDYCSGINDAEKINCFLKNIIDASYSPTVIIYSRKPIIEGTFKYPKLENNNYLVTVQLSNNDNNGCFFDKPEIDPITQEYMRPLSDNGRNIYRAIKREFSPILNKQPLRCVTGATSDDVQEDFC